MMMTYTHSTSCHVTSCHLGGSMKLRVVSEQKCYGISICSILLVYRDLFKTDGVAIIQGFVLE